VHALQMALSMLERQVPSGEQLIRQGETGEATDEMYVVRSGQFEVYQKRHESMMLVNKKDVGAVFGELGLLYTTPRSATVQAITYVTGSPVVPRFPRRRLPYQPAGAESASFSRRWGGRWRGRCGSWLAYAHGLYTACRRQAANARAMAADLPERPDPTAATSRRSLGGASETLTTAAGGARRDSTVWVLTRSTFKTLMQKQHVVFSEREVFLNSVPILAPLGKEQRLTVAELLEEVEFAPGDTVIREGDIGNRFYIIMEVRVGANRGEGSLRPYASHTRPRQSVCSRCHTARRAGSFAHRVSARCAWSTRRATSSRYTAAARLTLR
jgi:CRP-like cAMP-binding protein